MQAGNADKISIKTLNQAVQIKNSLNKLFNCHVLPVKT